eukprot:3934204-Rhodomonas_salina.1
MKEHRDGGGLRMAHGGHGPTYTLPAGLTDDGDMFFPSDAAAPDSVDSPGSANGSEGNERCMGSDMEHHRDSGETPPGGNVRRRRDSIPPVVERTHEVEMLRPRVDGNAYDALHGNQSEVLSLGDGWSAGVEGKKAPARLSWLPRHRSDSNFTSNMLCDRMAQRFRVQLEFVHGNGFASRKNPGWYRTDTILRHFFRPNICVLPVGIGGGSQGGKTIRIACVMCIDVSRSSEGWDVKIKT